MPYHTVSNIILLCAIVGIILLILRRLPQAVATEQEEQKARRPIAEAVPPFMGLSRRLYYGSRTFILFWSKRIWNFTLEAKGLRHPSLAHYRIGKIFRSYPKETRTPDPVLPSMEGVSKVSTQVIQDERYYLERIKEDPHNLEGYNSLGQFYIGTANFTDAQNVYEYLIKRDATSGSYYAKAAYCKLNLRQHAEAAALYEKSLALDSAHPNRYYNLALTYKILDRPVDAAGAIAKAIEFEPHNIKYKDLHAVVAQLVEQLHGKE